MKTPLKFCVLGLLFCLDSADLRAAGSQGRALGTSAAVDSRGRLWIAYVDGPSSASHVVVSRHDVPRSRWEPPIRVNPVAEPVSADGENRPKVAFGPRDEIYVTWTSPTSERFAGNVRFSRSLDGGASWSTPVVVHRDRRPITHRFDSLLVDGAGRVWVAWIDKRDREIAAERRSDYAGAAIYYAYSTDRGSTWHRDFKLADHSCECCRIAIARDLQGRTVALWRHVFAPNERDHAIAGLGLGGRTETPVRATFDRWKVDACPHQGPSLAYTGDGTPHAVWFNQVAGEGRVFYGRLGGPQPTQVRPLPAGARHADIAATGDVLAVAWKRFDGIATRIESWISHDAGKTFSQGPSLQANGDSDQPRLVAHDGTVTLVWRLAQGTAVRTLTGSAASTVPRSSAPPAANASAGAVAPFTPDTLGAIERRYRGKRLWLILWDLECAYCMRSLGNLAQAQRAGMRTAIVTISTDPISEAARIQERLARLGVESEAYAFSSDAEEALRYAIDPTWMGEKPRAYRYSADGKREPITGVMALDQLMR